MDKSKNGRIKFNWQDIVAIGVVLAATAGIFTWTYLSTGSSNQNNSFLVIKYRNTIVTSKALVIDKTGGKAAYSISLRRELSAANGESYVDSYAGDKVIFTASEFMRLSDFSVYDKKYLIVNYEENVLDGFEEFDGPQVDISIHDGGFEISKEDSPNHVCSNLGFVTNENRPVVCLPNAIYCYIQVGDGSSPSGPDA